MVTLRSRGMLRFYVAAFLGAWLCGWAVGECFALWLLGNGAVALMSGTPPGPAIGVGAFLLVWLSIWTLGGIAALTEFFRLLWGVDRIQAEGGGFSVAHLYGPFRSRREFPRDTLRRFVITSPGALAIETTGGTVELSRLGSREEREAAAVSLRSELGLSEPDPASLPVALPKGWEEIITPEGERAVVPDHTIRRVQARVAGVAALGLAAAAAAVIRESLTKVALAPFAVLLALGTIALGYGAVWLARGRMEWRIGSGIVTQRKRFGPKVRDVFEARGLEVVLHRDSDGDETYALDAVLGPPGAQAVLSPGLGAWKGRKRVTSAARDPFVPRQLGAYLARAGNVAIVDRTTPEARSADLAVLKDQLEKSGPLGRLAVRLADRKGRKQA